MILFSNAVPDLSKPHFISAWQIILKGQIYRLQAEDVHRSPGDINYFKNNLQEVIINPEAQVGFQYGEALVKAGFIMLTFCRADVLLWAPGVSLFTACSDWAML